MKIPLSTIALALVFIVLSIASAAAQGSAVASTAKPRNPIDKGDFKVGFSPATHAKDPKKKMDPEVASGFKEIADSLNAIIALPRDVYLNMDTCGEANAFYDPSTSEITICYELFEQYEKEFKTISKDPKEIDNMVEDTILQTLFHELGHCLID